MGVLRKLERKSCPNHDFFNITNNGEDDEKLVKHKSVFCLDLILEKIVGMDDIKRALDNGDNPLHPCTSSWPSEKVQ